MNIYTHYASVVYVSFLAKEREREREREKKKIIIKRDFDAQYFISAGLRRCRHCEFMSARTSLALPQSLPIYYYFFLFSTPSTFIFFIARVYYNRSSFIYFSYWDFFFC